MNRELAAQKIRACLESRIARLLECQPSDLSHLRIGTLVHTIFLLRGDSEELGGFNTSMKALLDLLGYEVVWDTEKPKNEAQTPTVIN